MNKTTTQKQPNAKTHKMASQVLAFSQDLNNVHAAAGTQFAFRTHYVDTAKEVYGIKQLIHTILRQASAIHPLDAHTTPMRGIVIGASLYFSEIEQAVRDAFGKDRYPSTTLRVYLANAKDEKDNKIVSFQLTNQEDKHRSCPKPRTKYYLSE